MSCAGEERRVSELDTRRRPRVQVEAPCSFVLLGGICGVHTLAVVYIQIFPCHHHNRPYHCERTASRLICEVKHGRARSVLGWGTTWEARVTIVFFSFSFLFFLLPCASRESGKCCCMVMAMAPAAAAHTSSSSVRVIITRTLLQ